MRVLNFFINSTAVYFQLDYKADRSKIKEIFKMAGKVRYIDLAVDKDGNSRGFAVIEYDHPVEAVQVSCLTNFNYYCISIN